MKAFKQMFLGAATMASVLSVTAQTADEIVNRHLEAIGGKEKLSQWNSMVLENTIDIMGNSSPNIVTVLNGKGYKSESEFNGSKIVQAFNDKGGWAINPFSGGATAEAMPDQLYKAGKDQLDVTAGFLDYAAKGNKIELAGKGKVNGSEAYKIVLTNKDNNKTTYFIDTKTYYITQAVKTGEMMGQTIEITVTFADHKKTDFGVVIPYSVETNLGQFTLTAKVNKVEINKQIDPAIFEMPKQ